METAVGTVDDRRAEASGSVSLSPFERRFRRRLRGIEHGCLSLRFPSGRSTIVRGPADGPSAEVMLRNWQAVMRLSLSGDLGLAEGYMAGDWDTPDLAAFFAFCTANRRPLAALEGPSWGARLIGRLIHGMNANSRAGSRRNIAAHYDLGNDFYSRWLDETMTYSAAIFADAGEPLADAQVRKYRRLADVLELAPGHRVLEIGCGWGGFAEIAARDYGCEIVCLTLSREQAAYTETRLTTAGLTDLAEVRLQDYRDVGGSFDRIVSIEMFEAVGQAYWPAYFDVIRKRLAPGGKAALQVITLADEAFDAYRRCPDFIQRYIFPGGMLPSREILKKSAADAGLSTTDSFFFGSSYAETLRRWDRAFEENWEAIEALGFHAPFERMWRYYLHYCIAGFDDGRIDVGHFLLEHR